MGEREKDGGERRGEREVEMERERFEPGEFDDWIAPGSFKMVEFHSASIRRYGRIGMSA